MTFRWRPNITVVLLKNSEPNRCLKNSYLCSSWNFDLHTIFMNPNYISIIVTLGFKIHNLVLSSLDLEVGYLV